MTTTDFKAEVTFSTAISLQFFKVTGFDSEQRKELLSFLSYFFDGVNGKVHFLKSGAMSFDTETHEEFAVVIQTLARMGCTVIVQHQAEK